MFQVKNLTASYENKIVLENISFAADKGIVGIVGPNGAGKSTLIKTILNLVKPSYGEVLYNNDNFLNHLKEVAYIPQRAEVNWDFPISVLDVVLQGLYPSNGLVKKLSKDAKQKALKALEMLKIENLKHTQISKLSGGQQQRVFMARAIVQNPQILFLDEPFVGIDMKTELLLMDILKEFKKQNKLIFIVHHDLSKVNSLFDNVIIINKELIAYGPVSTVFNEENLSKAYNINFKELGV